VIMNYGAEIRRILAPYLMITADLGGSAA
jgi:hypothetical protein